jgi:hypothetical protein
MILLVNCAITAFNNKTNVVMKSSYNFSLNCPHFLLLYIDDSADDPICVSAVPGMMPDDDLVEPTVQ